MKDKLFPYLTGVLCVGVALLAVLVLATRYHLPKDVARLSDVSAAVIKAVPPTNGAQVCQATITQAIEAQGGGKPIFGTPVLRKGIIYLHVHSAIYTGWASCKVVKSLWQALSNGPSGPPPRAPSS